MPQFWFLIVRNEIFWNPDFTRWQISFFGETEPLAIYNQTAEYPIGKRALIIK